MPPTIKVLGETPQEAARSTEPTPSPEPSNPAVTRVPAAAEREPSPAFQDEGRSVNREPQPPAARECAPAAFTAPAEPAPHGLAAPNASSTPAAAPDPRPVLDEDESVDPAAIGIRRSWFGVWADQLRRRLGRRRSAPAAALPPDDELPPL